MMHSALTGDRKTARRCLQYDEASRRPLTDIHRASRGHARTNSDRRSNCSARTGVTGVRVLRRAVMPRLLTNRARRRVGDALLGAAGSWKFTEPEGQE